MILLAILTVVNFGLLVSYAVWLWRQHTVACRIAAALAVFVAVGTVALWGICYYYSRHISLPICIPPTGPAL